MADQAELLGKYAKAAFLAHAAVSVHIFNVEVECRKTETSCTDSGARIQSRAAIAGNSLTTPIVRPAHQAPRRRATLPGRFSFGTSGSRLTRSTRYLGTPNGGRSMK